ncbi:hypothetical protein BLNAU_20442 [Blattamonas nauphoetae]|uniref:Uncharacterized protein n=1 Tax=Blattamonas nauphoetae TaxID=2049346 RepID=A0ABQ9WZA7_9EUKA|nr:hypothetical protein BLNAU_20442 [Blattamonas nauphoetae]
MIQLANCTTTLDNVKLTHLDQGAINMKGGNISIEAGTFHDNSPHHPTFKSFRRNIHCTDSGNITIESLTGGDGFRGSSAWISQNDCNLIGEPSQMESPLFIPTLSPDSKSTFNKNTLLFTIEISGSLLIPCGLWLEVVEITKDKTENQTKSFEMTSSFYDTITEDSISLKWRGRLIYGNNLKTDSFVIQQSSSEKFSQAIKDNMKWWIPPRQTSAPQHIEIVH